MLHRFVLSAAIFASLVGGPAAAQQDLSHMSCSDYLKAEHGSDWSQGVIGKPSIDHQPADKARRMRDFCKGHPQANAADVDRAMKK